MNLLFHVAGVCRANGKEESDVEKVGESNCTTVRVPRGQSATGTECHGDSTMGTVPQVF